MYTKHKTEHQHTLEYLRPNTPEFSQMYETLNSIFKVQ